VNKGILLESEARTNLLVESNDFTDASWTKIGSTVTANAVGPDGEANSAATLLDDSASGTGVLRVATNVTVATTAAYAFSAFVKADQLSWFFLQASGFTTPTSGGAYFDLSTGAVGSVNAGFTGYIEDFGDGWYRCSIVFTTDATDTTGTLNIILADADGDPITDRDGTSSILIYGAQFEAVTAANPYPSSYIPTAGATVTRAAETLQIDAANMPAYTGAVSIYMRGEMAHADTDGFNYEFADWGRSTSSNHIWLYSDSGRGTGGATFRQRAVGVVDQIQSAGSVFAVSQNEPFAIASRHGSTFINGAANGAAATANTTPTELADLSADDFDIGPAFNGTLSEIRVFAGDVEDTGLEEVTA